MSVSEIFEKLGTRHPIIRTGERAEIPNHVRSAVWYRVGGRCRMCTFADGSIIGRVWHLDHVIPWSAGGSDRSTNLRILCERHNMERSNYYDLAEERPQRPVTWWCINCFSRDEWAGWFWMNGIPLACPTKHPMGMGCRVIAGFDRAFRANGRYPEPWHERDPLEDASTLAYCAHCDAPGMTGYPL